MNDSTWEIMANLKNQTKPIHLIETTDQKTLIKPFSQQRFFSRVPPGSRITLLLDNGTYRGLFHCLLTACRSTPP